MHPTPPLRTLYPGGWVYFVESPQERSPLEDHLRAKFHPDLSSCLDFYREQTHRQILPFVY